MSLRVLFTGAAVAAIAGAGAAFGSPATGGSGLVSATGAVRVAANRPVVGSGRRAFAGRPAFSRAGRSDASMPSSGPSGPFSPAWDATFRRSPIAQSVGQRFPEPG